MSVQQELDDFLSDLALVVTRPEAPREPVTKSSGRPPLTMSLPAGSLTTGDYLIGRGTIHSVTGKGLMIVRCVDGVRLIPRNEVVEIHIEDDGQDG